jgi:hypothetical protein
MFYVVLYIYLLSYNKGNVLNTDVVNRLDILADQRKQMLRDYTIYEVKAGHGFRNTDSSEVWGPRLSLRFCDYHYNMTLSLNLVWGWQYFNTIVKDKNHQCLYHQSSLLPIPDDKTRL